MHLISDKTLLMQREEHMFLHLTKKICCAFITLHEFKFKHSQMGKTIIMVAAALLAVAVAVGAFGAHGLKPRLTQEMMQIYKTGVEYHFYHAIGLLLIGLLSMQSPSGLLNWSAFFLAVGILLFSGSLYLMAISGIKWLGAITPIGGLSFIAGWILLFVAIWKK
jgi:uncharacterized membrane protein YgdD (TMEM256/DUF423 family)